jgi:hypothetical protein
MVEVLADLGTVGGGREEVLPLRLGESRPLNGLLSTANLRV